jgi:hypothetical protein
MTHYSSNELIDAVEQALPPARAAHAEGCARCRGEVESLRVALAAARTDGAPEPSPLFWDHFTSRVREAIAHEPPPRRAWDLAAWTRRPVVALALACAVLAVSFSAVLWRAPLRARLGLPGAAVDIPAAPAAVERAAAGPIGGDDLLSDPELDASWSFVMTLAEETPWNDDDERALGVSVGPGSTERAVLGLLPEERAELARLLTAELEGTGF